MPPQPNRGRRPQRASDRGRPPPRQVFGGGLLVDGPGATARLLRVAMVNTTYAAVHAQGGGAAELDACAVTGRCP